MAIKFGLSAASQIARVVRAFEADDQSERGVGFRNRLLRQPLLEGFLIEGLPAAINILTDPGEAALVVLRQSNFLDEENQLEVVNLIIDVVNRSKSLTVAAGTYVIVGNINGEWRVVWADCEPSDEGSEAVSSALTVTPPDGLVSSGPAGGPFDPDDVTYTLTNIGPLTLTWTASAGETWFEVSLAGGTLDGFDSVELVVSFTADANTLLDGFYNGTVTITNATNGLGSTTRPVLLAIGSGGGTFGGVAAFGDGGFGGW